MSILDTAKDVVSLVQKIDNIDLHKKILSLQANIQKLYTRNLELLEQIAALKEEAKIKGALRFDGYKYFLKRDDGSEDGPFCQVCWDIDKRLVRLLHRTGGHFCDYCSNIRRLGKH